MPGTKKNSEKQRVVLRFRNLICVCRGQVENEHEKMAIQNKFKYTSEPRGREKTSLGRRTCDSPPGRKARLTQAEMEQDGISSEPALSSGRSSVTKTIKCPPCFMS